MDKPITVAISDCKKDIIKTINESNLPIWVLDYIMKDIYTEIHMMSEKQIHEDEITYNQQLAEEENKE